MAAAVRRRVRVEIRPECSEAVGGAALPSVEGADVARSMIAVESAPCEVLVGEGACWATVVAAVGASAEPASPSESTAKNEAKSVSAAGKDYRRPGRGSTVVTAADTRATNLPEGKERSLILISGPCVRKSRKNPKRRKGAHPQQRSRGGAPVNPSQHRGSVRNEYEARRPG